MLIPVVLNRGNMAYSCKLYWTLETLHTHSSCTEPW